MLIYACILCDSSIIDINAVFYLQQRMIGLIISILVCEYCFLPENVCVMCLLQRCSISILLLHCNFCSMCVVSFDNILSNLLRIEFDLQIFAFLT